jgi:tRNA (guanosine-2'-O-)-methyltransferase
MTDINTPNILLKDDKNQLRLINYLNEFITDDRKCIIENCLDRRTRHICVVLEDIFQSQNASAVLRTCDCTGVQNVHIIENKNQYNINPDVVLGSSQWLTINRYNQFSNNSTAAIQELKQQGYRIVATTPHTKDVNLDAFDVAKGKIALFFGTELEGLSPNVIDNADEFVKIPMQGFTESFNISVSAGILLYNLTQSIRNSDVDWKLNPFEKNELHIEWLLKTIKRSDLILQRFLEENKISFL